MRDAERRGHAARGVLVRVGNGGLRADELWILAGSARRRFSENRLGRMAASPSGTSRRDRVSGMSGHSWLLERQNMVGEISVRRPL